MTFEMSNATDTGSAAVMSAPRGGRYLTFALGREQFGLQILKVREIIGLMQVTAIPQAPPHVRGVINLRGQVISVTDLRSRFGMPAGEATEHACIIVVEATSHSFGAEQPRKCITGIIVDRVCEVTTIPEDAIEDAPPLGQTIDNNFILGIGKVGNEVKILLDIDRVVSLSDHISQSEAA